MELSKSRENFVKNRARVTALMWTVYIPQFRKMYVLQLSGSIPHSAPIAVKFCVELTCKQSTHPRQISLQSVQLVLVNPAGRKNLKVDP